MLDAVVDQRRSGLGQLQHGEGVIALTDAKRDRFARIPLLLLRAFLAVQVALPGLVRQHATDFSVDVDAGDLSKTQGFHEVMHGLDTHVVGQRVIVDVAGFDNALVHVNRAQPGSVASELMATEHPGTGVVGDAARSPFAGLQRGHCHEGFVG